MPKTTRYVGGVQGRRFRITVELCPDSCAALQAMLDGFNRANGDVGLSAVVRAALKEVHRSGAWVRMNVESLSESKRRDELRKVTRSNEPIPDFTND